jgi:hypothetical protein
VPLCALPPSPSHRQLPRVQCNNQPSTTTSVLAAIAQGMAQNDGENISNEK